MEEGRHRKWQLAHQWARWLCGQRGIPRLQAGSHEGAFEQGEDSEAHQKLRERLVQAHDKAHPGHMVTWSHIHVVTSSHGPLVPWSHGHMVTWSYLGHMVTTWSHDHMVTWSHGHMVTWSRDKAHPGGLHRYTLLLFTQREVTTSRAAAGRPSWLRGSAS